MAAPKKLKLDYVSWDTDWSTDPLVLRLEMIHGPLARLIFHDLANWGYKNNGYFFNCSEDELCVFCHQHRYDIEETKSVIDSACELGLFDGELFVENSILTSERMQKNFCEATKRRKLMYTEMEFMYTTIGKMYTTTPTNDTTTRQSKVKESKVNTPLTPREKSQGEKSRVEVSKKCREELDKTYGEEAISKLINEMQLYLDQNSKSYQNYDAALKSWAQRKLHPIPAWKNCPNPDCHFGKVDEIVQKRDGPPEIITHDCPICSAKSGDACR